MSVHVSALGVVVPAAPRFVVTRAVGTHAGSDLLRGLPT